jgi:hypothetical protein
VRVGRNGGEVYYAVARAGLQVLVKAGPPLPFNLALQAGTELGFRARTQPGGSKL